MQKKYAMIGLVVTGFVFAYVVTYTWLIMDN
jgi:hypothetical protein